MEYRPLWCATHARPLPECPDQYAGECIPTYRDLGPSLRDDLAREWLVAAVAAGAAIDHDTLAREAYRAADAMMAARRVRT